MLGSISQPRLLSQPWFHIVVEALAVPASGVRPRRRTILDENRLAATADAANTWITLPPDETLRA